MTTSGPGRNRDAYEAGLLRPTSLTELIRRRADLTGGRTFLLDEHDTRLSFADFHDRTDRVAAALAAHGVGPGSRVAWQLPTRTSTVLVMAALSRLGAVQAPVIAQYRLREVSAAVEGSGAEWLLVPGTWRGTDYEEMARGVPSAPRVLTIGPLAPELDDVSALPPAPTEGDQVRWIFFTSGSSGLPKGALHTDSSLLTAAYAHAVRTRTGESADEVCCVPFPVAHVGGPLQLASALSSGSACVLLEAFTPTEGLEVLRRHRATLVGGGPVFYQALLTEQRKRPETPVLPTLRTVTGGGAPCPPHLFDEVRDELGARLLHCYGMTESPMVCVAALHDEDEQLRETEGRPAPGLELRVMDGEESVPVGVDGEIQIRGATVCLGYTDSRQTAESFTKEGWFRTGDRGHLRPDGHVELTGRMKDLIIRKGEKIAPQELEQLLSDHPSVDQAAVIGLPDAQRGERVCAVLVLRTGAPAPLLADIADRFREAGLMEQKIPEQLEIVSELPVRGLGKVDKSALREMLTTDVDKATSMTT